MLSFGGMGCGSFAVSAQPVSSGPTTELIELSTIAAADGYGDTHVNSAILRCSGPITDLAAGSQYVAWHKQSPRTLKIAKRTYSSGAWGSWSIDTSAITPTTATDAHNFFSLMVDGSGRLHISGDMHGVAMNYAMLTGGSIHVSAWASVPIASGSTYETSVTYPAFVPLPNGDLLLFFRDGASGDGSLVMYRWTNASATWSVVHSTLVDGETIRSFYPNQIRFDPVLGRLHIGGCWRETTSLNTNHDIFYFYLELSNNFATAKKVDGSAQTLPVTQANAGYAMTIATGSGLVNTGGTAWFSDGRPILASFRDPGDGFTQLFLLYWDGSAWVHRWVPGLTRQQQNVPFSIVGLIDTWDWSAMSSPHLLHRNGRTIITLRADAYGTGVWAWISEDSTLQEWTLKQLDSTDVGEWTGSEDITQWQSNGEIYLYHQKAVRPGATAIGAQDVRVLRWRPQSDAYTYTAPAALWDPNTISGCIYYVATRVGGAQVHGTVDSNRTRCIGLLDARDSSTLFVQDTLLTDDPEFIYNQFGSGLTRGGVVFVGANSDRLLCTRSSVLTALTGINVPFILVGVFQPTSLSNQRYGSIGVTSDTTRYLDWGIDASGKPTMGRRVGGASEKRYTGSTALTAGTAYVISYIFDGTNGYIRVNGVQQGAAIDQTFTGTLTPTHVSKGQRKRAGYELPGSFAQGNEFVGTTIPSLSNIQAIENNLASEAGITF